MTLLLTCFAAVVSTLVWYTNDKARVCKIGILCYLYWGATFMWLCDAVAEYLEAGADYFTPEVSDMINDTFLGISVIALGMVIWIVVMLISDPLGVVKKNLIVRK